MDRARPAPGGKETRSLSTKFSSADESFLFLLLSRSFSKRCCWGFRRALPDGPPRVNVLKIEWELDERKRGRRASGRNLTTPRAYTYVYARKEGEIRGARKENG